MTREERQQKSEAKKMKLMESIHRFGNEVLIPAVVEYVTADMDDRYVMKIPANDISEQYGENCEKIFRLLFTLYQVGGLSEHKKGYVTMWVGNRVSLKKYAALVEAHRGERYTPKQMLEWLIKAGCEESRRIKLNPEPEVISGLALVEYKALVKNLRNLERLTTEYESAVYW